MGKAAILGEVASHAHHIATYVTGLEVEAVSAELTTFVERREVYDNSYVTARFGTVPAAASGAAMSRPATTMASGSASSARRGSLTWVQEDPEVLWFKPIGSPADPARAGL